MSSSTNIDIEKYLKRINYTKDIMLSIEGLGILQEQHLLNVPFENLDIYNNIPIKLNVSDFACKIIDNHRGGFCYELNGLFYVLLSSFGFNVHMISGRVFGKNKTFGEEFDHLAILTEIKGENYLTDVGFGEFTLRPLKIELGTEQKDARGIFKIIEHKEDSLLIMKKEENEWQPQYIFNEQKRSLEEFDYMCHYHQTSSDSHFTKKRIITKPTKNGRVTISGNMLIIKENGNEAKTLLDEKLSFEEAYQLYF